MSSGFFSSGFFGSGLLSSLSETTTSSSGSMSWKEKRVGTALFGASAFSPLAAAAAATASGGAWMGVRSIRKSPTPKPPRTAPNTNQKPQEPPPRRLALGLGGRGL